MYVNVLLDGPRSSVIVGLDPTIPALRVGSSTQPAVATEFVSQTSQLTNVRRPHFVAVAGFAVAP